jgi:NADPH2:quinone reductase
MSHAIRFHATGGPEVLRWEPYDPGPPSRGEVLIRQTAIGLNFLDVYDRTGLYPVGMLPSGIGREAVGVVEAVGQGVHNVKPGDRIAYVTSQPGAYAQERVVPANRLVAIPDGVSDRLAAAAMLKGLTAHYLLRKTHRVRRGDAVVVHAAAGGVGLILVQWARNLGAEVIAVTGSDAKAELARTHGAAHTLILGRDDLPAKVRELTRGRGADVVYDSVGKDTFTMSLDCLRPRGLMVTYGNASGPVPPFSPLELSRRGSLYLTRPTLFHYIATRPELDRAARELFDVIGRGVVRIEIGQTYALQDAEQAHRDLEGRRTVGSTVLLP